jgi:hypothetical protein
MGGGRGNIDNPAEILRDHHLRGRLHAKKRAAGIHTKHFVPPFWSNFGQLIYEAERCTVNKNIDAAKARDNGFDQLMRRIGIGHIDLQGESLVFSNARTQRFECRLMVNVTND